MTGVICALAGGTVSIYHGTAVVTVGYEALLDRYGFVADNAGSITPTNWASTSFPVELLVGSASGNLVQFRITGITPNAGWETLTIGDRSFSRADANYSAGGASTNWAWFESNPFGSSGTKAIRWS